MSAESGETPVPDSSGDGKAPKKRSLGAILLTLFLDLVGFSIIFPLFPAILDSYRGDGLLEGLLTFLQSLSPEIGIDDPRLVTLFGGVLGSVYSLLQFLLSPFWGSLSDRIGRRPVLLITIGINIFAAMLWAFSGTFAILVISRILAGVAGGNIATATAAVADVTPGEERARGMGLVGAAFGLGFILGPAIGGYLSIFDLSSQGDVWGDSGLAFTPFTVAALGVVALHTINLVWILLALPETRPATTEPRRLSFQISLGSRWGETVLRTNLANLIYLLSFSGMEFTRAFLVRQRPDFGTTDTPTILVAICVVPARVHGRWTRRLNLTGGSLKTATSAM